MKLRNTTARHKTNIVAASISDLTYLFRRRHVAFHRGIDVWSKINALALHLFTNLSTSWRSKSKRVLTVAPCVTTVIQGDLMNRTLPLILALLCAAIPVSAQTKSTQEKSTQENESDRAQLVATAEILKIDAKKMILQVREVRESTNNQNERTGGPRVGNGGGGGRRGGGRPSGGVGFPGGGGGGGRYPGGGGGYPGGGGGGYPGGGGGPRPGGSGGQNQPKEYKVYVLKGTTMKFAGVDIDFSQLHVGDHITVSGTPKGGKGDLDASAITRQQ
jgi:hypothetical protein